MPSSPRYNKYTIASVSYVLPSRNKSLLQKKKMVYHYTVISPETISFEALPVEFTGGKGRKEFNHIARYFVRYFPDDQFNIQPSSGSYESYNCSVREAISAKLGKN